jgi:hypothetical protein
MVEIENVLGQGGDIRFSFSVYRAADESTLFVLECWTSLNNSPPSSKNKFLSVPGGGYMLPMTFDFVCRTAGSKSCKCQDRQCKGIGDCRSPAVADEAQLGRISLALFQPQVVEML